MTTTKSIYMQIRWLLIMNLPEVELADVGPAWKCNKMIVKIKKYGYEINVRKSRRRVNLSTIQQNKTKHWGHWALLLQYIISRIVPVLCSGYSSPECNDSCFSTSRQISALIIVCVCVCLWARQCLQLSVQQSDLTTAAYNRLSNSGRKWVCGSGNMNAEDILSNIISLLTGLWKKLSVTVKKQSQIGWANKHVQWSK